MEKLNYSIDINLHKYCMSEIYPLIINEYITMALDEITKHPQRLELRKPHKEFLAYKIDYNNIYFSNAIEKSVLKVIISKEWNNTLVKLEKNTEKNGDIEEKTKNKEEHLQNIKVKYINIKLKLMNINENIEIIIFN